MRILAIPCRTIANMTLTVSRRTRARTMREGVAAVGAGSHDHGGAEGPAMQAAIRRRLATDFVTDFVADSVTDFVADSITEITDFVAQLARDKTVIPAVGDSGCNCGIFYDRAAALCGHKC
jgi:hypothetical protein